MSRFRRLHLSCAYQFAAWIRALDSPQQFGALGFRSLDANLFSRDVIYASHSALHHQRGRGEVLCEGRPSMPAEDRSRTANLL